MSFRLWYPQLDVYNGIRRLGLLLVAWHHRLAPTTERLMICDFYFANPPLLHATHMPEDIRGAFRRLGIDRPEKSFVSYPLAQVLFHKMEPVQRQALHTLVGKGLVATQELREGRASLSELGREMYVRELAACSGSERMLVTFLASQFGTVGEDQPGGLYRNTGLRRRG